MRESPFKYLGIMIDSTLTWQTHIDKISKKNSRALGLLYKIRPFINNKVMKTLYYSFVYPHLLYANEVWGSADITHLNSLIILQKRVMRLITTTDRRLNDFSSSPSDLLFSKIQSQLEYYLYHFLEQPIMVLLNN